MPSTAKKSYQHIFFDLDHTIWDFDRNAEETLQELYLTHKLKDLGLQSADLFIETYTRNNHQLWADYHLGRIDKTTLRASRFRNTFLEMGVEPEVVPHSFEDDYVRICPTKTNLFPYAHETLTYLSEKYPLYIISNGFRESQALKMNGSNLVGYFQSVIISELVGVNKPHTGIFQHAVELAGCTKDSCLMIGDSLEADVYGALNFGMDAIYFNPNRLEKPADVPVQIHELRELMEML